MSWLIESYLNETREVNKTPEHDHPKGPNMKTKDDFNNKSSESENILKKPRDRMDGVERFEDAHAKKHDAMYAKVYNSDKAEDAEKQAKANGEDPKKAREEYTDKVIKDAPDKRKEYNKVYNKLTRRNTEYRPSDSLVKSLRDKKKK